MLSTGPRGQGGIVSKHKTQAFIVTAAVIFEKGKVLVTQRKEASFHQLLWEFPGGKVRANEEPREALQRELREELGVDARVGSLFEVVYHVYPEFPILLLVYECIIERGIPNPMECRDLRWIEVQEVLTLSMPAADEPIRRHLVALERRGEPSRK
jgi:8-oxo-dGTP diphosphatase